MNIYSLTKEKIKAEIKKGKLSKLWVVKKDLIDVCKVCEYRYMCSDNRIPKQRNDKSWYHMSECNFNPYIGKWKGELNYQTLSDCGIICNNKEFYIDKSKLAQNI